MRSALLFASDGTAAWEGSETRNSPSAAKSRRQAARLVSRVINIGPPMRNRENLRWDEPWAVHVGWIIKVYRGAKQNAMIFFAEVVVCFAAGEHAFVDLHSFANGGLGLGDLSQLQEEHPLVPQREGQFRAERRVIRLGANRGPVKFYDAPVKRFVLVASRCARD